jgi:hypothetical protein
MFADMQMCYDTIDEMFWVFAEDTDEISAADKFLIKKSKRFWMAVKSTVEKKTVCTEIYKQMGQEMLLYNILAKMHQKEFALWKLSQGGFN